MIGQKGGRFLLSESKIKELAYAGLTAETYTNDTRYYRDILEYIVINSNITKLSRITTDSSLYGLIFKLTLRDEVESPLVNIRVSESTPDHNDRSCSMNTFFRNKCVKPVRTFLLKLSFISKDAEIQLTEDNSKKSVKKSDFLSESIAQNLAYEKTFDFGESVVPACLSPSYIDKIEQNKTTHPIMLKLLDEAVDDDWWLELLLKNARKKDINEFGLILMEFAEGFSTLREILKIPNLPKVQKNRAIILAKMAHLVLFEAGIVQGDVHDQNIMINLNYTGFLEKGNLGKALVIDFGRAKKLSKYHIEKFGLSTQPKKEDYQSIFHYLKYVSNQDGKWRHPPYNWISETDFEHEDSFISTAYNSRINRGKRLQEKFIASIPNIVKKELQFNAFLSNPDFSNFIRLRWSDSIKDQLKPNDEIVIAAKVEHSESAAKVKAKKLNGGKLTRKNRRVN